jgi:hypothetical protein
MGISPLSYWIDIVLIWPYLLALPIVTIAFRSKRSVPLSLVAMSLENQLQTPKDSSAEAASSNALQAEIEHTLMGRALGQVRNLVSSAPKAKDDQVARAQQNDQIAEMAVDVLASISRVKLLAAGAGRALALFDPTKSIEGQAGSLALNFAGGMAINGAVRLTQPGTRMAAWTNSTFASGMKAEGVSHFINGMGFSAARTAFDSKTWLDQSGNISITDGLKQLALSTAIGSVVNVPAGFVGSRIGSALSTGVADSLTSRIATGIGSGFGAGGVFGFTDSVISTGSLANSGSAFLDGAVVGGLTGGFASSFHGGPRSFLDRVPESKAAAEPQESQRSKQNSLRAPEPASPQMEAEPAISGVLPSSAKADAPDYKPVIGDRGTTIPFKESIHKSMEFKPSTPITLDELRSKIGRPQPGKYVGHYLDADAKYEDQSTFRASVKTEDRSANSYRFGPTEIVVPKDYDDALAEVRHLRQEAGRVNTLLARLGKSERQDYLVFSAWEKHIEPLEEVLANDMGSHTIGQLADNLASRGNGRSLVDSLPGYSRISDLSPQDLRDTIAILKARVALNDHPLRFRALPEDMVPLLEHLPNRGLVKRIELLNEDSIYDIAARKFDPWIAATYGDNAHTYRAEATADISAGAVRFYKAERKATRWDEGQLERTLKHEQVHFNHDNFYAYARSLDEAVEASAYGYRNDQESEAELESLAFLTPNAGRFLEAVERAPLRMSLLASKLLRTMEAASPEHRSLDEHEIIARARYVEDKLTPKVIEIIQSKISDAPPADRDLPIRLLVAINDGRQNPEVRTALLNIAKSADGPTVHQALNGLKKIGGTETLKGLQNLVANSTDPDDYWRRSDFINAMRRITSNTIAEQERALVQWAQPDSPISNAVRDYLPEYEGYNHINDEGMLSRSVSDDLMALPSGVQNISTLDRARYTLEHGDDFQKLVAAFKLGLQGDASDSRNLLTLASRSTGETAATALHSALQLITPNKSEQFDHLERMALSESPYKTAARTLIDRCYSDARGGIYRSLLKYVDNLNQFDPKVAAYTLARLPNTSPRAQWRDEILSAIDSNTNLLPETQAMNRKAFLEALSRWSPKLLPATGSANTPS